MRTFFSSPSAPSSPPNGQLFLDSVVKTKFELAEYIIMKWEQVVEAPGKPLYLLHGNRADADEYLRSVMELQSLMHYLVTENPASEKLVRAQKLMSLAMNRLQKEFRRILFDNRTNLDSESLSNNSTSIFQWSSNSEIVYDSEDESIQAAGNSVFEVEPESDHVMWNLKAISETMISSGYKKECISIYKMIRRSIIDESLYQLGVEKTSSQQVQKMGWELVEVKIKSWLKAVKTAIMAFHHEKLLCERVFSRSPYVAELCFCDIATEGATTLFGFPEHVAMCKRMSPEKIFRVLDLYDAVSELLPQIESIFSYESISSIRTQAVNCIIELGKVVRNLLVDFEAAIHKDNSKSPVPNGGVHPLTRYVANYLIFLSDYSAILTDILWDFPMSVRPEPYISGLVPEDHPSSVISEKLAWFFFVLFCKLDVKGRLYNDVAVSCLFLANNVNYVVSKVHNSNLKLLLGDYWLLNHEKKLKQYAENYVGIRWSKVISSLPNPTTEISLNKAVGCLRSFNVNFNEAYGKQRSWVVPDHKLRDEIKILLAKKLVPVYREFYERYLTVFRVENDDDDESIIKYSPEDLANYLSDLFY